MFSEISFLLSCRNNHIVTIRETCTLNILVVFPSGLESTMRITECLKFPFFLEPFCHSRETISESFTKISLSPVPDPPGFAMDKLNASCLLEL